MSKASPYNPLMWLASLRLTIVLLALSIFLIFVGTLAQVEQGIWVVVEEYFRSLIVWVKFDLFNKLLYPNSEKVLPGGFWMPGGFLLLGLLVVNLIAAHAVRYKVTARGQKLALGGVLTGLAAGLMAASVAVPVLAQAIEQNVYIMLGVWAVPMALALVGCNMLFGSRKSGIVLIHVGLILLLLGEFVTGLAADEGRMMIPERGASNYVLDDREPELAFVLALDNGNEKHVVIPRGLLRGSEDTGEPIDLSAQAGVGVQVRVDAYFENSDLSFTGDPRTPGAGTWKANEQPEVSGTTMNAADMPSAMVTLLADGKSIGQFLFSTWHVIAPRPIEIDGKTYTVQLRFKRTYLPYTVQLNDFTNDTFTGTQVARNYASDLRLIDPQGLPREAYIKMNQPLRYDGKAFFQSGFFQPPLPRNTGTILQVVDNPGSWIPYMSCVIVTVGLCAQFGFSLARYGRRVAAKGI